jgi:hypothetical protein
MKTPRYLRTARLVTKSIPRDGTVKSGALSECVAVCRRRLDLEFTGGCNAYSL